MHSTHGEVEIRLRVQRRAMVATDVVVLDLTDPAGADLPAWAPGAHIDLLLSDGITRQYSLCGDPADRRSVLALITDAGLERINAMRQHALAKQAAVAKGFTADQLVQLRHLCLLLVRNLRGDAEGS